jgi:3-hydroxybutyrate dehydrogenase
MKPFDFRSKSVLITGASSGIGYAVARGFAESHADLVILAQDKNIHRAAAQISEDTGNDVRSLLCDVSDREAVSNAISTLSCVDVLVNNAGIERVTPIDSDDQNAESDFDDVINVNLTGAYNVTRKALSLMPNGGKIVFTASTWSKTAYARMGAYCASKHAVLGIARALAHELGPRRINVNSICPGWVKTDQSYGSLIEIAEKTGQSLEAISEALIGKQAIGGQLIPEDMVNGYLFLASDLARDITGQSLHIDRGELMS